MLDSNYRAEVTELRGTVATLRLSVKDGNDLFDLYRDAANKRYDSLRAQIPARMFVKEKRFGIGVSGGYGVGKLGLTPFFGVSAHYTFIKF